GGRTFTSDEARDGAAVAIVTRSTRQLSWPDQNPIGRILSIPPLDGGFKSLPRFHSVRVIGVTADASPGFIGKRATAPVIYYPQPVNAGGGHMLARVTGDAEAVGRRLDHLLATVVDSGAVQEQHTLDASLAVQVYPFRAA